MVNNLDKAEMAYHDRVMGTAVLGTIFSVIALMSVTRTDVSIFGWSGMLTFFTFIASICGGFLFRRSSSTSRIFHFWGLFVYFSLTLISIYLCLHFAFRLKMLIAIVIMIFTWLSLWSFILIAFIRSQKRVSGDSPSGKVNSKLIAMGSAFGAILSGWLMRGGELYFLVGLNFIFASVSGVMAEAICLSAWKNREP